MVGELRRLIDAERDARDEVLVQAISLIAGLGVDSALEAAKDRKASAVKRSNRAIDDQGGLRIATSNLLFALEEMGARPAFVIAAEDDVRNALNGDVEDGGGG